MHRAANPGPTPFADVNTALALFSDRLSRLLDNRLAGLYVVGSLALDAYDPRTSDVDLVVVLRDAPDAALAEQLAAFHRALAADGWPWSTMLEVVYADHAALSAPPERSYPQLERGGDVFSAPLEDGWVFQRITLRDHALTLLGPPPRPLVGAIADAELRIAAARIADGWLAAAHDDPTWLPWLAKPSSYRFVAQTLCRLRYSLATGGVAAKPRAAAWAAVTLPPPWPAVVGRLAALQAANAATTPADVGAALELIRLTSAASQNPAASSS